MKKALEQIVNQHNLIAHTVLRFWLAYDDYLTDECTKDECAKLGLTDRASVRVSVWKFSCTVNSVQDDCYFEIWLRFDRTGTAEMLGTYRCIYDLGGAFMDDYFVTDGACAKNGLTHDFLVIAQSDLPDIVGYPLLKSEKVCRSIAVPDSYILKNSAQFMPRYAAFPSFWHTLENQKNGLDYYGTTILPPDMIPAFLNAVQKTADCAEKRGLILLCESALKNDLCLVHFGI